MHIRNHCLTLLLISVVRATSFVYTAEELSFAFVPLHRFETCLVLNSSVSFVTVVLIWAR